jgi:hypothetical protein
LQLQHNNHIEKITTPSPQLCVQTGELADARIKLIFEEVFDPPLLFAHAVVSLVVSDVHDGATEVGEGDEV